MKIPNKQVPIFLVLITAALFSGQPAAQQATAERTLLNGLRVQIVSTPAFPKAALRLLIGAGTTLDPVGKAGLADLSAALLLESVPDWQGDPENIGKIIEAGKTIRYSVDWDSTQFWAECDPAQLDIYMQAFSRLVRNPVMSEKHFPAVREQALKRFSSQAAGALEAAIGVFNAELFRGNPYARLILGTPDTLGNVVYGEAVLFQRRYHLPNVSFLAIAGNVNADQVKTLAGRNMGVWIMDDPFPFTFTPPAGVTGRQLIALDWAGTDPPAVTLGCLGVERTHRDYAAQDLIARILAARTRSTPDLAIRADARRLRGALRFALQRKELNLDAMLKEAALLLAALRENGPTAEELAAAVQQALGDVQTRTQTAMGLTGLLTEAGTYQLGFNYFERLKQDLPALTPADLKLAAQRLYDPANFLAIFIGQTTTQNLEAVKAAGWQVRQVTVKSPEPAQKP